MVILKYIASNSIKQSTKLFRNFIGTYNYTALLFHKVLKLHPEIRVSVPLKLNSSVRDTKRACGQLKGIQRENGLCHQCRSGLQRCDLKILTFMKLFKLMEGKRLEIREPPRPQNLQSFLD